MHVVVERKVNRTLENNPEKLLRLAVRASETNNTSRFPPDDRLQRREKT